MDEAKKVRAMIKDMPKLVREGQEWFVISMSWIKKWQAHCGFDSLDSEDQAEAQFGPPPGKIDNTDIISYFESKPESIYSSSPLQDTVQTETWQNI